MRRRLLALAIVAVLAVPALAGELAPELRILIDGFAQHRRLALGYLRTGNTDLGAVEIERLRDRWSKDARALPPGLTRDRTLAAALTQTETNIRDSLAAADKDDSDRALSLLERAAAPLMAWRQSNAIRLFSDCIVEASAAYERLDRHRLKTPDLDDAPTAVNILTEASAAIAAMDKCDTEASPAVRGEPEFRRLIDGMKNSLDQVPEAVTRRDNNYLHRLLIEQRSFDRLLAFRYG